MPKKAYGRRFVEREKAGRECGVVPNPASAERQSLTGLRAVFDCVGSDSSRTLFRAYQS